MKTKKEVKLERNDKGQFINQGKGSYKRKIVNGHNLQAHRVIWEKEYGEIPEGYIIHHIDGDKTNPSLDNLDIMTVAEHTKLHHKGDIPWNKGKKCPQTSETLMGHEVTEEQIETCKETWRTKFLPSMLEIAKLREKGLEFKEIAKKLNLSYDTAFHRYRKYKKDYECQRSRPEIWSRAVGYLRPVEQWHAGKQTEFKDRKTYDEQITNPEIPEKFKKHEDSK